MFLALRSVEVVLPERPPNPATTRQKRVSLQETSRVVLKEWSQG
jgi:hypothetical protein